MNGRVEPCHRAAGVCLKMFQTHTHKHTCSHTGVDKTVFGSARVSVCVCVCVVKAIYGCTMALNACANDGEDARVRVK